MDIKIRKYNKNILDGFQMQVNPRRAYCQLENKISKEGKIRKIHLRYSRAYCPRLVNKISKKGKIRQESSLPACKQNL